MSYVAIDKVRHRPLPRRGVGDGDDSDGSGIGRRIGHGLGYPFPDGPGLVHDASTKLEWPEPVGTTSTTLTQGVMSNRSIMAVGEVDGDPYAERGSPPPLYLPQINKGLPWGSGWWNQGTDGLGGDNESAYDDGIFGAFGDPPTDEPSCDAAGGTWDSVSSICAMQNLPGPQPGGGNPALLTPQPNTLQPEGVSAATCAAAGMLYDAGTQSCIPPSSSSSSSSGSGGAPYVAPSVPQVQPYPGVVPGTTNYQLPQFGPITPAPSSPAPTPPSTIPPAATGLSSNVLLLGGLGVGALVLLAIATSKKAPTRRTSYR